jgi:ligand-binding sensor domain-containing protein
MKSIFLHLIFFFLILSVTAQEYGYTRYDTKDGLAGSTVYCMTQDKDGFMWYGTETGLSRFDGTHFKNFTQDDGLPDNEIIQLFADSKGRVWISPFRKSLCYYYKGKIYTSKNDSSLKHIQVKDNIVGFAEDDHGNVLMQEISQLHLLKPNGEITTITKVEKRPFGYISSISRRKGGGFWIIEDENLLVFENNRISFSGKLPPMVRHFAYARISDGIIMYMGKKDSLEIMSLESNKTVSYHYNSRKEHHNVAVIDSDYTAALTINGATVYDMNHPERIRHFLTGIALSNVFKDSEGNWWFSSFGKGVFRLNSAAVYNLKIRTNDGQEHPVFSLNRYKETILAGSEYELKQLSIETGTEKGYSGYWQKEPNPVITIYTMPNDEVIYANTQYLIKLSPQLTWIKSISHVSGKAMCPWRDKILVASDKCILEIDPGSFVITDTIWHERATTVYALKDTIYIGSLNGLYRLLPDKTVQFLGDKIPFLRSRTAALTKDSSGIIWVATFGEGVVGIRNDSLITRIGRKENLTSDICRAVFLHHNDLWIGTDRGVNKINLVKPGYPITKYTTGDGLSSDIINAIYVYGSKVFIGTSEGVSFFDEQAMSRLSHCDLTFTDITIGEQTYYPTNMPALIPHAKNDLQFNYVGISYKSAGNIRYRYRLLGLDSNWKETRETFLSYPTLPSGDYQLQVQAINKFDVVSKMITAGFTIEKLMWETTWFRLLMGLVFLAVTGSLGWLIISRIRRREQEKTSMNKKIGDLEQLARKAQMNPHFIFNSLNSIQQYVMDADITGANKFISGFSRLIRQTLDFSSKQEISLEQELGYLSNYLELEKTRLENAFGWSVSVADDVKPSEYHIPPMILQPFVENSVRHGLRFRRDRNGMVNILIKKENNYLVCILEDNGIGRKAALQYKSINAIEYQSKGMSLTAERIAMLNKDNPNKITMSIEDLEDDQHKAVGTRVTINFPIS